MSKFYAQGNVSSDSDDEQQQVKVDKTKKKITNMRNDLRSQSSDQQKRVVRTQKDKKQGVIKGIIAKIKQKMKISDFNQIWALYQELQKQIDKMKKIIQQEGCPNIYIKLLVSLIDFVNNYADKKKLNATNSKSYSIIKQKLKKTEKDYEKQIQKQRANPSQIPLSPQSASQQSQDQFKDDESGQSSQEQDKSPLDSNDPMIRRQYWLKKKKETTQVQIQQTIKPETTAIVTKTEKKKPGFNIAQKKKITQYNIDESKNKLKQIARTFGKQIDYESREDFIYSLNLIKSNFKTDIQILACILIEIPFRTQAARSLNQASFKRDQWNIIYSQLKKMFNIIQQTNQDDILTKIYTYQDQQSKLCYSQKYVLDSIRSFFITLEQQLRKAFTFTDFNDIEYSLRLQDLIDFIQFSYTLYRFFNSRDGFQESASDVGFKLIENIYYMNSQTFAKIKEQSLEQKKSIPQFLQLERSDRYDEIFNLVIKYSGENKKIKMILYTVYHQAIQYKQNAKDLLLITDVLEKINNQDYYTQAIFNRAIVQLGLNAFRNGNMYQVQGALSQLCTYGKTKELLAQSYSKPQEKDLNRKRILPYHLHINVDLIESVELIASMILEIPFTIKDGGRITSKTLKKVYQHYERSHFIAEPLNSRDLIYSASKQLQKSNWKQCFERLQELSIWKKIRDVELTKKNLLLRIKEQSLKCFLFGNQQTFISISLTNLSNQFQLPISDVKTIVNRLIFNNQVFGSITQQGYLKLSHPESHKMQKIIYELYQKVSDFIGSNQRDFDERLGNYVVGQDQQNEQLKEQKKKKNVILQKYKIYQNKKGNKRKN